MDSWCRLAARCLIATGVLWLGLASASADTPSSLSTRLGALLPPGDRTRVSFRFTAIGIGARWQIDDVFVDPYAKL